MDRIIYTAMTGASASAQRQAVLANNLANASTIGFRAEMSNFRAVPMQGSGSTTRVFALEATSGPLETPGPAQTTGRALDAMPQGNAWFAVQALDGSQAYTRAGHFEVTPEGQLVTANGLLLLSDGDAPIDIPPDAKVALAEDGSVLAQSGNDAPLPVARLKLATPTDEQPLARGDDGLMRTPDTEPLPADPEARLQTGVLEGSNVNTIACMVDMIAAARQFEQQMRLLQTAETDDKTAARLLGLG